MPTYVYRCQNCHAEAEVVHSIAQATDTTSVTCGICGQPCYRRPQVVLVNWGGLAPSQGELSPVVKDMIEAAPARRDKMVPHMSDRLARLNGVLP